MEQSELDTKELKNIANSKLSLLELPSKAIISLLKYTSDYVLVLNQERLIVWASESFYEDTGYDSKEIAKKPFEEYLHPDDMSMIVKKHTTKGDIIQPELFIVRFNRKTGDYLNIEINMTKFNLYQSFMMVIGRPEKPIKDKQFAALPKPAKIITEFKNLKGDMMSSGEAWWKIFDAMHIRDIHLSSEETVAWQCKLAYNTKDKGTLLMDWHRHNEQEETVMMIDGLMLLQVEKKRWWYRFFNINKKVITHYETYPMKAGETHTIPKGVWHSIIGGGKASNYVVFWNPKKFM